MHSILNTRRTGIFTFPHLPLLLIQLLLLESIPCCTLPRTHIILYNAHNKVPKEGQQKHDNFLRERSGTQRRALTGAACHRHTHQYSSSKSLKPYTDTIQRRSSIILHLRHTTITVIVGTTTRHSITLLRPTLLRDTKLLYYDLPRTRILELPKSPAPPNLGMKTNARGLACGT